MNVVQHYTSLIKRSLDQLNLMAASQETTFVKAHNFIDDLETMKEVIATRPEAKILSLATREYQLALYALASSNYRHAFVSLRLFFELSLSTILFSSSEIKLRQWLSNRSDIIWAALIDEEDGVYAKSFVEAFQPELASSTKQYRSLAQKVYRECSEHVHGNFHTHPIDVSSIDFKVDTFLTWTNLADSVRACFIFAYTARFLDSLSKDQRNQLEHIILDELGSLPPVQEAYQKDL